MKSGGDSLLDFTHTAARKYGARVLARETNRGVWSKTDDRQTI